MFDTEKFICEIEARPPLYDVQLKVKAKCWYEVAVAVFDDWDELNVAAKDERGKNNKTDGLSFYSSKSTNFLY